MKRNPAAPACLTKAFAAGLAALLLGCVTQPGKSEAPPGEELSSFQYAFDGKSLIIPVEGDSSRSCIGDTLKSRPIRPDTLPVEIARDTLRIIDRQTNRPSGARVERFSNSRRIGSGSGLDGTWLSVSVGYRVTSGSLTGQEREAEDAGSRSSSKELTYGDHYLRFAKGRLTQYEDRDFARRRLDDWTGSFSELVAPDSAGFSMDARRIDRATVEYKGRATGETVKLTFFASGDKAYVSDNPSHPPHRYKTSPIACPNDWEPLWFLDFLEANRKNPI